MNFEDLYAQNRTAGKTVRYLIDRGENGRFIDLKDGTELDQVMKGYSRMKFGDVPSLQWWGRELSAAMIEELKSGGVLREMFASAGQQGEYVYLTAPGVRNVISASNRLLWEVGQRVNVWLSQHGLPTVICRQIARLGSGRANYAELSAEDRKGRKKSTKSLIPASDYAEYPIHVLFLDDVEVTGATVERARHKSLEAGALSFHSIFAIQVDPDLAATDPGIEHQLNQFEVSGRLDPILASILSNHDYQPVQRMLRLLLHPRNRSELSDFLIDIPDHILLRLYTGAMSNDYLWINHDPNENGPLYRKSLELFSSLLRSKGLVNPDGIAF